MYTYYKEENEIYESTLTDDEFIRLFYTFLGIPREAKFLQGRLVIVNVTRAYYNNPSLLTIEIQGSPTKGTIIIPVNGSLTDTKYWQNMLVALYGSGPTFKNISRRTNKKYTLLTQLVCKLIKVKNIAD